jgi:NAD(P)-dependent dehydrogenase (short-subunit alcohol dehydrogenase family)
MTSQNRPVWFVTGCSTGFGLELAKLLIARGYRAVITARDKARRAGLTGSNATASDGGNVLALDLDVTNTAQIAAAVDATEARFGRIDVLVNNAGYGYQAAVEEGVEAEIRALFEANVFGLFALTRAVLPVMRQQRSGHVINITSVAGYVGFPASGYYAASKHAVEGFSDSLLAEVQPLGIKVSCVAPGAFRTDWAGRSLKQTPNHIAEYAATAGDRMRSVSGYSGKQPGDPARAAAAMIQIAESKTPPRHLVLGSGGLETVTTHLRRSLAEIEAWRDLSLGTDLPKD